MGPQLGTWKYCSKPGAYVSTNATSTLTTNSLGATLTAVDTANNSNNGAIDVNAPYEGNVIRIDSFPIADDEDGLYTGREFSIPISLLLGFFRIKNMIPTFALGSIDIKLDFAKFEAACLISLQHDRYQDGRIYPTRMDGTGAVVDPGVDFANANTNNALYRLPQNQRYYEISDIYCTFDVCSCDPSYNTLLSSLISSSSVVLPYESYSTIARTFQNAGSNQLLISRGCSYLKNSHSILKAIKQVDNPVVMNDQHIGGDIYKSHQIEIGSKLYNPQRCNTLIGAWREKEIAMGQYNRQGSGTAVPYSAFCCKADGYTAMANLFPNVNNQIAPNDKTKERQQPNLDPKCQFIISQSYEKVLGGNGNLSGLNSRLSGYNLHLDLELQSENFTQEGHVNYPWYNDSPGFLLITYLHMDRSLILTRDSVQISE